MLACACMNFNNLNMKQSMQVHHVFIMFLCMCRNTAVAAAVIIYLFLFLLNGMKIFIRWIWAFLLSPRGVFKTDLCKYGKWAGTYYKYYFI